MNFLMTACTKTHQVAFIVRAAVRQRYLMMNESRHCRFLFGETLLTKRMSHNVSIPYLFPHSAVAFAVIISSSETLVMTLHFFSVFLAVATLMVG